MLVDNDTHECAIVNKKIDYYECPYCECLSIEENDSYCHSCGIKLDWEDDE